MEEKKNLTEEERKELKENLKKQIDEMSNEELDKVAGGFIHEPDDRPYEIYGDDNDRPTPVKCSKCGSSNFGYKSSGIFTCNSCGAQYKYENGQLVSIS